MHAPYALGAHATIGLARVLESVGRAGLACAGFVRASPRVGALCWENPCGYGGEHGLGGCVVLRRVLVDVLCREE